MRALQNIIQEIYYEKKAQPTQVQYQKINTEKIRIYSTAHEINGLHGLKIFGSTATLQMHTFFQGPVVFLYIKKIFPGVFDDKKTFLVSALGLNWTSSDSRTNRHQLDRKLLAGLSLLLPSGRKEKRKKERRKKSTFKLLSKSWFFSVLFLLKQETLKCKSKSRKYFTILKSHL